LATFSHFLALFDYLFAPFDAFLTKKFKTKQFGICEVKNEKMKIED